MKQEKAKSRGIVVRVTTYIIEISLHIVLIIALINITVEEYNPVSN